MSSFYRNPIYKRDFADPGLLRTEQGLYAYGSQGLTSQGMQNIQVAFSLDGIHWEPRGDALPQKASWATDQDYWAPHVIQKDGRFYLFYNARTNNSGQGIGVATSDSPEGPFVDSGQPLVFGEGYINIDAFVFHDESDDRWWMCWGSNHQPIKLRKMESSLMRFADESTIIDIFAPDRTVPFGSLQEAPCIHRRFDPHLSRWFYYLYTSGDDAFGLDSYGVMVARSDSIMGPYQTLAQAKGVPDSVILRGNQTFLNPGAHSMFTDDVGQEWLLYHAYERADLTVDYETLRKTPRVLLLDALHYDNSGWPFVQAGTPSVADVIGPTFLR